MAKKKKDHSMFDMMASKKNSIPFTQGNKKYSAQAAPKKMVQQRRMGAK